MCSKGIHGGQRESWSLSQHRTPLKGFGSNIYMVFRLSESSWPSRCNAVSPSSLLRIDIIILTESPGGHASGDAYEIK